MIDIKSYLQKIAGRFADARVQANMKGFTKTIQFQFSDTHQSWLIQVVEGKEAVLSEGTVEKPDIAVTTTTDILAGVLDKKINAASAYMQRKIQVKGAMEDLLKMQILLM